MSRLHGADPHGEIREPCICRRGRSGLLREGYGGLRAGLDWGGECWLVRKGFVGAEVAVVMCRVLLDYARLGK
jgi:hypothetical protein